ncbi:MAG: tRNA (N(6)-L-threonylcarbamoyladenosine(37)-C(2))-methylthiotransferase MtaB [Bacteriovoracaceae bacterium]
MNTQKTVSFYTLGCRLNMSETGSIAQGFAERGYEIVEYGNESDVVFINTCTVTDGADSSCRNIIRQSQKSSPDAKIVVAGCYAQMEAEAVQKIGGVDLILGTNEKYNVFKYLDESNDAITKIDLTNEFWGAATTEFDSHTRAFLKIQDGCNYVCSFCIIPFARGRARTISIQDALIEAQKILDKGFKEIVLTGVNIGEYEHKSKEKLSHLVEELLKLDNLKRLRMSSVEPNTITDELLTVMKSSEKFLDHFHIPLQSGDDEILKSMRRKYTSSEYSDIAWKIKNYFPYCGIGADIIVGYPGETEEQFQNTYNLLETLPITHFHVFPYSKRKGTTASKLENQVNSEIKKKRVKILQELGEKKLTELNLKMVGLETEVLFETLDKNGFFTGYSTNFLKVKIPVTNNVDLNNQILRVKISEYNEKEKYLLAKPLLH